MFELKVTTKKGTNVAEQRFTNDCLIGKARGNSIILRGRNVSKLHAIIDHNNGGVFIEDCGSEYGTFVNGNRINRHGPLSKEDTIAIGDYYLYITAGNQMAKSVKTTEDIPTPTGFTQSAAPTQMPVQTPNTAAVTSTLTTSPAMTMSNYASHEVTMPITPVAEYIEKDIDLEELTELRYWHQKVHQGTIKQMDLRRINVAQISDEKFRDDVSDIVSKVIKNLERTIPKSVDKKLLAKMVIDEAMGLGPLEDLLEAESISEIMVNSFDEIFYESAGRLHKSKITFSNHQAVLSAIERIIAPLGRRIDESSPYVDARLKDGSRVNAIIPPLALKGPCITIRKFMKKRINSQDLINFGTLNHEMVEFIKMSVHMKRNILVSGGTGSGKTTLLNVLSGFIPENERIITVEDAAELRLSQPNLVTLEARPANQEGQGEVTIRTLVRNCLRMRPDRIIVGECRGAEALDMLQAMNTGHDGSLTTAHANSPRDCLSRVEIMVMMAGMDLPVVAIRDQIASAINLVVQQRRFSCGRRIVTSISEITGVESGIIQIAEIFKFEQTGFDANGKTQGYFTATGVIPEFYEDLRKRGIPVNYKIFKNTHNNG